MSYETIIVAFDTAARATAAIGAIRRMGVPEHDIRRHPVDATTMGDVAAAAVTEETGTGFWAWLFGGDAEQRQIRLYQSALSRGGTVVSVRVLDDEAENVRRTLISFGPLDLKEADAI